MITAVVTAHNYGRYLKRCIDSAFANGIGEVLVYDDGSTDGTAAILATYGDRIRVTHRPDASGCPVWGSNLGIEQATGEHLIFLDADNYLTAEPPQLDYDYVFAPIEVVNNSEKRMTVWEFADWPTDAESCWQHFLAHDPPPMPFPWGGVWRTSWLKGKRWRGWDTTQYAQDMRTALDWCKHRPTLAYSPQGFLTFRNHAGQWSQHPDRDVMYAEARLAKSEPFALLD